LNRGEAIPESDLPPCRLQRPSSEAERWQCAPSRLFAPHNFIPWGNESFMGYPHCKKILQSQKTKTCAVIAVSHRRASLQHK
jgi:hypothetical protein